MDAKLRSRLHDMTLNARKLLVNETENQLEGVYGFRSDGSLEDIANLPALSAPYELDTRTMLEQALSDEHRHGMTAADFFSHLTREVAFTWLNRLAAFTLMEYRELIRPSISQGAESDGVIRWLVSAGHEQDLADYEHSNSQIDARGEAPRDRAYRHYLLDLCAGFAKDIPVLFDTETLPSRLFPRPGALSGLIHLLNDEALADAWKDFETIGWIYQSFNEEEKNKIDERLNNGGKILPDEIPAATQIFTPKWIVKQLIQNTLGRMWLCMHPDSQLFEMFDQENNPLMDYFIPDIDSPVVPLKNVSDIKLLDPACGTMHFGLVAFDIFAAMYQEEFNHAGEPTWPKNPSVQHLEDIPSFIISNNLYGLDIDTRAVQLSALTLFLKAKAANPHCQIHDHNLVCSSVVPLLHEEVEQFLYNSRFEHRLYNQLFEKIVAKLKEAKHLGSLMRLDADFYALLEGKTTNSLTDPFLPGLSPEEVKHEASHIAFWNSITDQIVQAFDRFSTNADEIFFANQAKKGLRILQLMLTRYDIIVVNPPYRDSRDYNNDLKKIINREYTHGKRNLFAAFQIRAVELLAEHGRLGMVTPHSFMSISSFEDTREYLRRQCAIETLVDADYGTFDGYRVDPALFTLRREPNAAVRDAARGVYIRLVNEPNAAAKQSAYERAARQLQHGKTDPAVFYYTQKDFDAIPGAPWVYYITPGIRNLFRSLPKLGDIAPPKHGMSTGDNNRFLRFWWEIPLKAMNSTSLNIQESFNSQARWFPYMKGGSFQRWWGNQEWVVNYWHLGTELKEEILQKYPYIGNNTGWVVSNESFYFQRGVTYSFLTSGNFNARLSPGGFIFDVAGSSLFPDDPKKIEMVLALLNATFVQYALSLFNPTVNFQVGDLTRLPIPRQSSETVDELVHTAVALQRQTAAEDETTYEFVAPISWDEGLAQAAARAQRLAATERAIDEEVYRLYAIGPEDRAAIEEELAHKTAGGAEDSREEAAETDTADAGGAEAENTAAALTKEELAARWVSYAVGVVLGRYQVGANGELGCGRAIAPETAAALQKLIAPHGIATLDTGHTYDLGKRVEQALTLLLGRQAYEEICETLELRHPQTINDWLGAKFFPWHITMYRKRPIYWLLQSPKKHHSVYLYHERATPDTLHLIQSAHYLESRRNYLDSELQRILKKIAEAKDKAAKRDFEQQKAKLQEHIDDLIKFFEQLQHITHQTDERGGVAGWQPEPDDGALINMAPLWPILPSWPKEPKKCWAELERGSYDWSHTAMRYWPNRVRVACQTNRSYAIAHGIDVESKG